MKKVLLLSILLVSSFYLFGQTELTLSTESAVNTQIKLDQASDNPADVYIAESGKIYFWDATLSVDFDLHIKGTSSDWIGNQDNPPVFVPVPNDAGDVFAMVNATSGSIKFENILMNGINATEGANPVGQFIEETGASEVIVDNCGFSDFRSYVMVINSAPDLVSIKNCIMINGLRYSNSPWGGGIGRFNNPGDSVIIENNTVVNSGRLLGDGGNFYQTTFIENHNSFLNSLTNAQSIHWKQGLMANNIFYNWSVMGATPSDVAYNYSFTNWAYYDGLAVDSVSLYNGRNLLYRDPKVYEHYEKETLDTLEVRPYIVWNQHVDTTVQNVDNFTIGKSYWDIDPEFTSEPNNFDKMMEWVSFRHTGEGSWPDWRVQSAVTYDDQGQPVVSWPPNFDLSYSNQDIKVGATDGLPIGDLNWFPNEKENYLENRDSYIAALEDSITNAKSVFNPEDSLSYRITADDIVAIDSKNGLIGPKKVELVGNYPNPFNPSTNIEYKLANRSEVTVTIYNILGEKVKTLFSKKSIGQGTHKIKWNGIDNNGKKVSAGIYFAKLKTRNAVKTEKMLLLK